MKKVAFALIFLSSALHALAQGDSVVWNFTDGTTNPANNLTMSEFSCTALTAVTSCTASSCTPYINNTSAVGNGDYTPSSQGNNYDLGCPVAGVYVQWTVTPKSHFKVGVTAIEFGMRSTSSGPKKWALRSSADDYASDIASDTNFADSKWKFHAKTLSYVIDEDSVTFRIYFSGSTGTQRNLRLDDIKLNLTPPVVAAAPRQLQISTSLNTPSAMPVVVRGMMLEQDVAVTSTNPNFTVDKDSIPLDSINASPQALSITFSGAAAGSGKIVLKSAASGVDITDTVFVSGAVGMPAITVSPEEVGFNTTETNHFALQTVKVTGSYLSDSIYLDVTAGDSVFSVSPKTLYKVANQAAVTLRYTPLSAGFTEGTLRLRSAHAPDVFVSVTGLAIAPAADGGIPEGYYLSAENKRDTLLKTALHNIIKGHIEFTYDGVWLAFYDLDIRPECAGVEIPPGERPSVWDIYTDRPGCLPDSNLCTSAVNPPGPCYGFKAYRVGYGQQGGIDDKGCGTEGCSYNREHSFPKSWWNNSGTGYTQHNDLHHLLPTDRGVNTWHNNFPYGEVAVPLPNRTSANGSKLGACTYPFPGGYTGTAFEPIDEYKGDLARNYFYMATRYENEFDVWGSYNDAKPMLAGNKYPGYKPWAVSMLLKWHRQDPVSKKEKDRNNTIYSMYQKNRNPYIDHPELAEFIWGDSVGRAWKVPSDTVPIITKPDTFYTVAFDARGGSSVPPQQVKRGSLAAQPASPARKDYTFEKWVADTVSKAAWNFSASVIICDTTLYATWTRDTIPDTPFTAVGKIEDVEFSLFPNPNAGEFTILLHSGEEPTAVEVYSTGGTLYPCTSIGERRYRVSAPSGLYVVRVVTHRGSGVRKFQLAP